MDFLKKAAGELKNSQSSSSSSNNNEQTQQQNQGGDNQQQQGGDNSNNNNNQQGTNSNDAGQEDYLDKGIGFVSKKAGYNMSRENEEKIGDGLRNAYEKYSHNKVPEKFSN
ncbi:hypothetical protein NLG97_g5027 [Lecanicillium saksenae]|uniref:Uncharacterized protein n=1 Tax=Lecanicillium saksenae TaxID=468837 RepID=A0ACC1QXG8_9HYPO|nr:hypothetical protein NLG97_g5027 [Lecanicillium saksenae]